MFTITDGKGFQIEFENGWTISVQFGGGNYCSNRQLRPGNPGKELLECKNAEVAIFDDNGDFVKFPGGDVVEGYVSANKVAEYIMEVSQR